MKISFFFFFFWGGGGIICSKHMHSASGNYTLDILFYKKKNEKRFSVILTKSKGVAFSLFFSIFIRLFYFVLFG